MVKYIISILTSNIYVWMSWGADDLRIARRNGYTREGLSFKVNGFKFKGRVTVLYNGGSDLFDVFLKDKNGNETKIEGLYFDNLVETIDNHIEKTENYKEDVEEWLEKTM